MGFDGGNTAEGKPHQAYETGSNESGRDVQDAYIAPLHRKLKSRHLQMIGKALLPGIREKLWLF